MLRILIFTSYLITAHHSALGHEQAQLRSRKIVTEDESVLPMNEDAVRALQEICPSSNNFPLVDFTVSFDLTPQGGFDTSGCGSYQLEQLGQALNAFLLDYGIGPSGKSDGAEYLAEVCKRPYQSTRRRAAIAFIYRGGGACRMCPADNTDGRRSLWFRQRYATRTPPPTPAPTPAPVPAPSSSNSGSSTWYDPNWFTNIYAPEMQNTLRNGFTTKVAPNHIVCLGNGPRVDVTVKQVADFMLNC